MIDCEIPLFSGILAWLKSREKSKKSDGISQNDECIIQDYAIGIFLYFSGQEPQTVNAQSCGVWACF